MCQDSRDVLIVRKSFPLDCIIHNAAVLSLCSTAAQSLVFLSIEKSAQPEAIIQISFTA